MIEVLAPGLYTTIQDAGRPGLQHYGVAVQGAADIAALILGNRLVGNDPGAAALEVTLLGPTLRFHTETVIAITGADLGATLNEQPVPVGCTVTVRSGDVLAFRGGRRGCRAYICVAGGIDVEAVRGSRSTDPLAGIGGLPDRPGEPLNAGDVLRVGRPAVEPADLEGRRVRWSFVPNSFVARVVLGPQEDFFPPEAVQGFFTAEYTVTPASDRMGLRLEGPPVPRPRREVISEGQPLGAIQILPNGLPIVLLAGRATAGGYPKLGIVVSPDVALLAQARPGDRIQFKPIDGRQAEDLYRDWWRRLHGDDVIIGEAGDSGDIPRESPCHVDTDISSGDDSSSAHATTAPQSATADRDENGTTFTINSPWVGIAYRRPRPDAPPFVTPGAVVEAGQTVALVEVMKTFLEVKATRSGIVHRILFDDESLVTEGQPLVEVIAKP